ncbi:MAG: RDD family protein [Corallococcus sp.]|nr:RDD family protein [Corallococcus sp.]MCM1359625.1 RDD family protein [Corallococcus sp.]MCM1395217.1 RDD family protein [Corallococcus sp.]
MLDFFLIVILAVGVMYLMALITGIGGYSDTLQGYYKEYGEKNDVDFAISEEEFSKLSKEEQERYDEVFQSIFREHEDARKAYSMTRSLPLLIITISILIPVVVFEFVIPLCLKNGKTVGKKVFNLGVVFKNSVRISTFALFVRAILGKYTIELMAPAMLLLMVFYYNVMGIVGLVVVGLLLLMQIVILIATKTNACIHDVLANTVVVDMQTQMVFNNAEEMVAYKEELHQEETKKTDY